MGRTSRGLTLVEVLIAIVVLGIGVTALASSSGMVTRMIARGKVETRAAQAAASRMEGLRLAAYGTSPRCTSPAFASGGPVLSGSMTESWQVSPSGKRRRVRVVVTYLTVRGSRTAELESSVEC
jgi:prepilin-type N-terminal cleavage/methylation domain-containing protein